jgi:hypothetical protein
VKCFQALRWRVVETGTNGVKYSQWFNLTSESLLVNNDGRIDVCSIFFPVGDFLVDHPVGSSRAAPFGVRERIFDTRVNSSRI